MDTPVTAPAVQMAKPIINRNKAEKYMARYADLAASKAELKEAYDSSVKQVDEEMSDIKDRLNQWALDNQTAFKGQKSLKMTDGVLGFKLGAKAISFPLDGADDIRDKFLSIVKAGVPEAIEEKVDSKKLIGLLPAFPKVASKLSRLGIVVGQPDNFYITPNK